MGGAKNSQTRSLVASTRFQSNETVLDNIDSSNTVSTSDGIGGQKEVQRFSGYLATFILQLRRKAFLEMDSEILRSIRSIERINCQFPKVLWSSLIRVLENPSFI